MKDNRALKIAYSAVQGTFWMGYSVWNSFAAHYLQQLGYSNAQLGLILAAGSLFGAVLGPFLSSMVDRKERVTPVRLIPLMLLLQLAGVSLLIFSKQKSLFTTVVYIMYFALALSVNSLNLKLYVDFSFRGLSVDYGFTRGMGSLAYVLVTLLIGSLIDGSSITILPVCGIVLCLLQGASHFAVCRIISSHPMSGQASVSRGTTIPVFIARNRRFCIMLLGTMLIFTGHNFTNNFLINITRNVGGSAGTMGYLNALIAASEIPVMLLFYRFCRRKRAAFWLSVSFVAFLGKSAAVAAASNIPVLAVSLLLQAPSFALYTAGIVSYVQEVIPYQDSAKGQSLAFTMTTVGSVFASIVGGRLFDAATVSQTLWIAAAITLAGTIVGIIGVLTPKAASKQLP